MCAVYIYALLEPGTGRVRYVGKTNNLKRRVRRHCVERGNTHRHCWLQSLRRNGFVPVAKILEICNAENWQGRESWWIRYLRRHGCELVNIASGGNGAPGYSPSAETRAKIAESVHLAWEREPRKLSKEHREVLSAGCRRAVRTEEWRQKISAGHIGKKVSEETCRRISEGKQGKSLGPQSEETRRKISQRVSGEKNGHAKLTMQKAIEIRSLYADGAGSLSELGRRFGVDTKQIHRIVRNEAWIEA